MSLINKMLLDLDARGGVGDADAMADSRVVKAVPVADRERLPLVVAVAGMTVVLLAAGGWYGWQYWQEWRSHDLPAPPVPQVVIEQARPQALPPAAAPLADRHGRVAAASVADAAPPLSSASQPLASRPAGNPASLPASPPSSPPASAAFARPLPAADASFASRPRRSAQEGEARSAERKPAEAEGVSRRELTPKVESDSAYRRALVALQEGRVSVAMADLERAVEIDPRNESARQTYVSLLLESKRPDEAIRQLRLSLGVDPRQPALAMVLARLQLERGGPALATLMKTLPHATNNADYLAFLAGVLQREQRHADAARYYRDALQIAPNNGVWWMGLGISLQAEQHLPEARDAYARARSSAGMTAELLAFTDRKLEQLAR